MNRELKLTQDILGAPVRIGQRVAIHSSDATVDERFLGRSGVVVALHYDCSDPQRFPCDPMILVEVEGLGSDLFFARELVLAASAAPALELVASR